MKTKQPKVERWERGTMKKLLRSVAHIYETDKIGTYNDIKRVDYKTLYLPDSNPPVKEDGE